jgi:hypothetical protein
LKKYSIIIIGGFHASFFNNGTRQKVNKETEDLERKRKHSDLTYM